MFPGVNAAPCITDANANTTTATTPIRRNMFMCSPAGRSEGDQAWPCRDTPSHTHEHGAVGWGSQGPIEQVYLRDESPQHTGNVYGTQSKTLRHEKQSRHVVRLVVHQLRPD